MVGRQKLRTRLMLGFALLAGGCWFVAPALALEPREGLATSVASSNDPLQGDVYIIGPGDVLGLNLFDAPELSGELDVLSDGSVSLPLVGSVVLSGLTLHQASEWVRELLSDQMLRPELQLKVVLPRPIRVSVVGAVERPGLYSLTTREEAEIKGGPSTTLSGLPTLVDAIQKAGGITQQANLRAVQLQRRLPGTPVRFKLARLNLLELVKEGDQLQNPYLFDGDTIKLDRAEDSLSEELELAATNLSPKEIDVNVIGEVNRPGPLKVMANAPLAQVVLAAGGLKNNRANSGNVELLRINRNGTATLKRFRFNMGSGASNETNPPLRQGDTVRVGRSLLAKGTDALGAVTEPMSGLVTVWSLLSLLSN
jgi:polysaccharide export outer membrane protein